MRNSSFTRLHKQQFQFAEMVGKLLRFIYEQGYVASLGDAWARDGHCHNSFHYRRLAIDLNIFEIVDDKTITYFNKTEDHKLFGEFWESLGGSWGGRWQDGNHYSLGE